MKKPLPPNTPMDRPMDREAFAGRDDQTKKELYIYRCPQCGRERRETDQGAYGPVCNHQDY